MRLFAAAVLALSACSGNGIGDSDDLSDLIVGDACPGETGYVTAASYVGMDVTVTAMYPSCASTHPLSACWNGRYAAGQPYSAWVEIHHEPDGDCLELVPSTITFSISPIVDNDGALGRLDHVLLVLGSDAGVSTSLEWRR